MNNKSKKIPLVSIIIATHNSAKTLGRVLKSIKNQSYPKNRIEILVIDGDSGDNTINIARKFKCRILKNPRIDQVYGKYIGYLNAKGRYALLLDSDEVLKNKKSIARKIESIGINKDIKAVVSSGYERPRNYPSINSYMSEFGDPFTYFMYKDSKDPNFFINNLVEKYKVVRRDKDTVIFDFYKSEVPPFIELTSMAVLVDLKYIKRTFPSIFKNPPAHTHLFYLLNSKKNLFAVMRNDIIIHYSAATLTKYLKKIKSRIKSNIYSTSMGVAGYKGREKYQPKGYKLKKFMFILYVVSIMLPLVDSIYLALSRGRAIYLLHIGLCLYTLLLIIFYYSLKLTGVRVNLVGYGK